METIEFLGVLMVAALIIGWYLFNEEKGSHGERGILALRPDPEPVGLRKPRYRLKTRNAARARDRRTVEAIVSLEDAQSTYASRDEDEQVRRRFRRQDETRYRVKDLKSAKTRTPPSSQS